MYEIATIQQQAVDLALDGNTYSEIAGLLSMDKRTLFTLRQKNPQFKQLLDDALFDASTMVVDDIKSVPYIEPDPAMARVKIEALKTYLEMRWPSRYGRQVNVNVKVLDMRDAIDKARRRSQAQVIDMYPNKDNVYTDSNTVAIQQALDYVSNDVLTLDDMLR